MTENDPDRATCHACGCDIWDHNAPESGDGCGSCGDCEGWR